ncbi:MAG: aminoacetone oxidase family FAD-binding enzyme [Johnsonella sp.]|nr:aminoacetone oxidase family FAD-binding enzyme [Johnsonella sp.]
MKQKEIGIIGAGAAGLAAGIFAAREGGSVRILEHGEKAAKKILMTGNGKCNYTNALISPSSYHEKEGSFVMKAIERFSSDETIAFFKTLGVEPLSREGYIYPRSEQASSIRNALLYEAERLGIKIETSCKIKEIRSSSEGFIIQKEGEKLFVERLIIASGSLAASFTGSDGSAFRWIEKMGHHIIKPLPALCAIHCKSEKGFFKLAAGVRVKTALRLYIEDVFFREEFGEVQITDYGLSGIPVFQLSRTIARALAEGKKAELSMDLLHFAEEGEAYLLSRHRDTGLDTLEKFGNGLFNQKLWQAILKLASLEGKMRIGEENRKSLCKILAKYLSEYRFLALSTAEYDKAQVCTGGVDLKEIDENTMESKLRKGLYFAGEVMDADGICGGYNLQWAWTSAYIAGKAAAKREGR